MIQELQMLIEAYLAEGKHRTLHGLAAKAQVSYSTVRRIAQGECKTVELSSVLGILKVVSHWGDSLTFLRKHFVEVGDYFTSIAKACVVKDADLAESIDSALESALYDYERFVIVSLAASAVGTTSEEITTVLGVHALTKVEPLFDAGVLKNQNGRIFTVKETFATYDNSLLVAEISHCTRFIRDENIGKQRQHCVLRTHSVSREGQKQVHAIIQKALVDAEAAMEAHQGGIPIFLGALMGAFLPGGDEHA